jgi:hypothetical protein
MKTKTLKVYGLVNFLNKIACYLRTFNPLAAGSIPARPTKIKDLQSPAKKATSTNVHTWAAVGVAFLLLPGTCFAGGWPAGWDFYFFGINTKMIKESDYKMVALGAVTSLAVHTAGHYLYAAAADMHVRQDGFKEIVSLSDNSTKEIREFAQAGFILQHAIGVALTTIPATRQTDFTKGYVAFAFLETLTYPAIHQHTGDLSLSDNNGGNGYVDYAVFMTVATHNVLRVKWEKD